MFPQRKYIYVEKCPHKESVNKNGTRISVIKNAYCMKCS